MEIPKFPKLEPNIVFNGAPNGIPDGAPTGTPSNWGKSSLAIPRLDNTPTITISEDGGEAALNKSLSQKPYPRYAIRKEYD